MLTILLILATHWRTLLRQAQIRAKSLDYDQFRNLSEREKKNNYISSKENVVVRMLINVITI